MTDHTGPRIEALLPSFLLSLEERELSPHTVEVYERTGKALVRWLAANGLPDGTEDVTAAQMRAFLAAETKRTSAVSSHQHYRNLRVLFKWLAKEDERKAPNPMLLVDEPKVTKKVKPVIPAGEIAALLRGCEGTTFEARRDMAIIRIFIDSGVRVGGMGAMLLENVSLPRKTVKVVLKGGDEHLIPLGRKAAAALDRYLRIRARHDLADSPWLWLGIAGRDRGHFGAAGIQDMVERRGKAAGFEGRLTPHWFRRTFAHDWLDGGGSEADGMRIAGWKTPAMMAHYAGELAVERARNAHARLSPGDRV